MAETIRTFQDGIKDRKQSLTDYALFLGGLNVTAEALQQYDPLRTGYGRIFMIRQPLFLKKYLSKSTEGETKYKNFKHILEYANTGISGNNNIQMQFNQMQGGYTNRSMEIPNIATDESNELTIKVYEFAGSPVREYIQLWINGVSDLQSGFAHYYGEDLALSQANHTAEFVYVVTDPSGTSVEYAALFANCFPKEIKFDHFNYESGQHNLAEMDLSFTCTRYMSPQINDLANKLIKKYNVLVNSLNFNGGYTINDKEAGKHYNGKTGKLEDKKNVGAITEKDMYGNDITYKNSTEFDALTTMA